MPRLFPIFLKLQGRCVLVIGAGKVGESKVESLLDTDAQIKVVALDATDTVRAWARKGSIEYEERAFVANDLDGMYLVVVATGSAEVNRLVFEEAGRRGIPCNAVDVPERCDFFYPAVVKRGDLQIAISTSGQSPSLAQRIRQELEQQFGPGYGQWVAELGTTRRAVLNSHLPEHEKRSLLKSLASQAALEAAISRQTNKDEEVA